MEKIEQQTPIAQAIPTVAAAPLDFVKLAAAVVIAFALLFLPWFSPTAGDRTAVDLAVSSLSGAGIRFDLWIVIAGAVMALGVAGWAIVNPARRAQASQLLVVAAVIVIAPYIFSFIPNSQRILNQIGIGFWVTLIAAQVFVALYIFSNPTEWMRSIWRNRKSRVGVLLLLFFIELALFAPAIAPVNPTRMGGSPHEAPNAEHYFGTSRQGQDIFAQVVHGSGTTLAVGFTTGTLIIGLCILIGVSAGFFGGLVDETLSLLMNIFLVLPGLPLIIVVAGWVQQPGPVTVVFVLGFTSWAYGARVLRSQTLTLRNSEFVAAARVVGEPGWRIVLFEILPNMTSLVVSAWIGAIVYVILTEATLSFIGLGNPNSVSWGTTLYWAQNNQALLTGAWWTFVPPGVCIALVGISLTLINYGIDEITNPRLRVEGSKA